MTATVSAVAVETLTKINSLRSAGRPRSIPDALFETVLQLYSMGYGYRSITTRLRALGVSTTHTTIRRLLLGLGAYARCPTCGGSGRFPSTARMVPSK